jgi:hypothetical protein
MYEIKTPNMLQTHTELHSLTEDRIKLSQQRSNYFEVGMRINYYLHNRIPRDNFD